VRLRLIRRRRLETDRLRQRMAELRDASVTRNGASPISGSPWTTPRNGCGSRSTTCGRSAARSTSTSPSVWNTGIPGRGSPRRSGSSIPLNRNSGRLEREDVQRRNRMRSAAALLETLSPLACLNRVTASPGGYRTVSSSGVQRPFGPERGSPFASPRAACMPRSRKLLRSSKWPRRSLKRHWKNWRRS